MEMILGRDNMMAALRRVVANKGAPGVDGMPVEELRAYLKAHWPRIKEDLLAGPLPAGAGARGGDPQARWRGAPVGHPDGGGPADPAGDASGADAAVRSGLLERLLRLPAGAERSQAVAGRAGSHGRGPRWVVDLDLEKFFDRVNHDVLMARVARRVGDKRVLRLDSPLPAGRIDAGRGGDGADGRGRRKAGRSRRCCRTSCSTISTRSWSGAAMRSAAMPTTATSTLRSRRAGERVMAALCAVPVRERLRLAVNRRQERG